MDDLPLRPDLDHESDGEESSYEDDELLGGTLSGLGLAQTVVDLHTANELGLVRSEVKRLRSKVERLEHEKEMMVDDFNVTTQMLLDRIRILEKEKTGTDSRPQTAAILERVEATWGKDHRKPAHRPEVMRIDEEDPNDVSSPEKPQSVAEPACIEECKECGNCGQLIPEKNFATHTVFCYRDNFHCAVCKQIFPVKDKDSHIAMWTDPERLICAASNNDMETLQTMTAHGADFHLAMHPQSGDTVLHVAAARSDMALIELCMGYGVDVDPMNSQGETPLHIAATKAEAKVVRLLAELGANLNISNGSGESPLMLACRRGATDAARYLLEKRADAEARTKLGDTALEIAQRSGFQETVLALSMGGASLRSGTPKGTRNRSSSRKRSNSQPRCPDGSGSPTSRTSASTRGPSNSGGNAGYPPLPPARKPAHSPTLSRPHPQTIAR